MPKRKGSQFPIYVADFETTSEAQYLKEGQTKVYLWEYKDLENKVCKRGVNIESFFYELKNENIPQPKAYKKAIVYFHNLSFDGEFILWYLERNGYNDVGKLDYSWNVKKQCFKNLEKGMYESIITDTGSIFMITACIDDNLIIEFRCSYKIFPNSIDDIGKLVGVKKLKELHNYTEEKHFDSVDEVPQIEWDYLENDVEILRRIIEYLNSIGMTNISMATNSYKYWRKDKYMLVKQHMIRSQDERVNEAVEKSYRGGITMINKAHQGELIEKAISLDVNSLYPSVMYNNDMPIGEGHYFDSIDECKYPIRLICIYISKVNVIDGLQPFIGETSGFSFDLSYNYNREIEDKFIYLWECEYNLFKQVYQGVYAVKCCIGFKKTKNLFKDYIDYWMNIKMSSPKDSAMRQFAKLMLNSLYGKFGMNSLRYSKKCIGIEDGHLIYDIDESQTFYYYKPIASYITSLARCVLVKAIISQAHRFIYCDTDSIYLKGWEIPDNLPIDDKKLGYWKFEHYYNHFKGLKAKCYLKDWTENGIIKYDSSIAGLPKDARNKITYENFKDGLKLVGVKKCKKKVKGGIIIGLTDFSIKVKKT